ncbi:MAG: TRAP transporter large permease [Moorellales bacterium]
MSSIAVATVGLVAMFALLLTGVPVGVAMGVVGLFGLWAAVSESAAIIKLAVVPFQTITSYDLASLPLFLFMANVFNYSGMGRDLFNLAYKWLGRLPGGVGLAAIAACGGFSAISASSIATAATVGAVALPEMKRFKYDDRLATGCIAAGGTIGTLIPPSGILIIYGILTETSIGKLFLAGWIPGMLVVILYAAVIFIICRFAPALGPRGETSTLRERFLALKGCIEVIGVMLFLLIGLLVGWFTATEAGAVGSAAAIISSLFRKKLTWEGFTKAIWSSLRTSGMIYGILIGAFMFNYFLASTGFPTFLSQTITHLNLSPLGVIGMIILIFLILGTLLDEAAMHVLTIPIFFPVIQHLGINPIWFGILTTRLVEVAMISPPLGVTMFVVKGLQPEVPMARIYQGVIPFLIADAVSLLLLVFIPELALFLPNLAR